MQDSRLFLQMIAYLPKYLEGDITSVFPVCEYGDVGAGCERRDIDGMVMRAGSG